MEFKSFIFNNEFEEEQEEIQNDFWVKFCVFTDTLKIELCFYDFTTVKKYQWELLINAVKNNLYYGLDFCKSNGNVSITTNGDYTKFCVSKHGAGGDGEMLMTVKNSVCLPEFMKIFDRFKK